MSKVQNFYKFLICVVVCMFSAVLYPLDAKATEPPACSTTIVGQLNPVNPSCLLTYREGTLTFFFQNEDSSYNANVEFTKTSVEVGDSTCHDLTIPSIPPSTQSGPYSCNPANATTKMSLKTGLRESQRLSYSVGIQPRIGRSTVK
ncbi:hypothetical protein [[Scytonema hofmanni] UTEX B 1581]|uniref:hypothetical protein n=1 Tax=[Scytonema hofmanni] UTEX B 1581 TaxID=379535 RepID=UPI000496DEE7|nr:hypothetical protein [[Scytonema hofmanni] UTEX B 1581]